MSEFDSLQKLAVPSARDNRAGDDNLKMKPNKKRRAAKLVSADEAVKALATQGQVVNPNQPEEIRPLETAVQPTTTAPPAGSGVTRLSEQVAERLAAGTHREPSEQLADIDPKQVGYIDHHPAPPIQVAALEPPPMVPTKQEEFLGQKARVTMELADGMFTIPVIAVRPSTYSVMVITPLRDDTTLFVPKPGTQLTINYKDQSWPVYFPGSYVEIEELDCGVLSFIKAGD